MLILYKQYKIQSKNAGLPLKMSSIAGNTLREAEWTRAFPTKSGIALMFEARLKEIYKHVSSAADRLTDLKYAYKRTNSARLQTCLQTNLNV